jgi:hypothetical protein
LAAKIGAGGQKARFSRATFFAKLLLWDRLYLRVSKCGQRFKTKGADLLDALWGKHAAVSRENNLGNTV